MNVNGLKQRLATLATPGGTVDLKKLDALMVEVRDAGGLSKAERTQLLLAANGFDDAGKQRLLTHLSALEQKSAWVNLEVARGSTREVQGRYAVLSTNLDGLDVKLGLFDSTFALSGRPAADGVLELKCEGQKISVPVKAGESPKAVLDRVKAQLPKEVTGVVLGGDARLHEPETFNGRAARKSDAAAHLALYKPAALGLKPGEKPLRVVVTGYGAFMGITDNPSANMAQKLAALGVSGAVVEYRRLAVTHEAVDAFLKQMERNPPDVILSMGVSSTSQVEERPENVVGGGTDGEGKVITPGQVRPGAAQELPTDLPVAVIDQALGKFGAAREVGTSLSSAGYSPDRSAYLCNYLGFNLADRFGKTDATTAGFVHVTEHTPPEQLHALLEAVVARQLDVRRGPKPVA